VGVQPGAALWIVKTLAIQAEHLPRSTFEHRLRCAGTHWLVGA